MLLAGFFYSLLSADLDLAAAESLATRMVLRTT